MSKYVLKRIDLANDEEYICLESHCRNMATMTLTREKNDKTKDMGVFCNFHSSINQEYFEWKEHFAWMNLFIWIPVLWAIIYFPTIAIGKSAIYANKTKVYKRNKHGNANAGPMYIARGKANKRENKRAQKLDSKVKTNQMHVKSSAKLWKASFILSMLIFFLFFVTFSIDLILLISGLHFITGMQYLVYSLLLVVVYFTYFILSIFAYIKKKRLLLVPCLLFSIITLGFTPISYIGIGVIGWFALTQIIIYGKLLKRTKNLEK
ncbi:hypothetical protein [Spiroplasma culicicola]|uniref:Transmembrane protein n=1 Tax=Spiroplasma culicicola AES-1 TaxID=1276246 RepID=W6A822_9MOLU|nr:hypothetical protein [Spiroplasma culicicola]AHI53137.1 hypothetical protein SCULI_v1c07970 [Spiroplasma culicicola AES-1]